MIDKDGGKKQPSNEKPISLKPLKFEEAVSDLLKVKPETKNKKTKMDNEPNSHT